MALPSLVRADLEQHLSNYVEVRPDAPLFTRPSGLPLRRADLSEAWRNACDAAGVNGVRPHDLRHHAATVIARNPKVTLRELMAAIGHWSPVAALRHQHATAEWSKAIASYLDDVIELARSAHESARIPRRLSGAAVCPPYPAATRHRVRWWAVPPTCTNKKRRRAESNRRTGLCRGERGVRNSAS